MTRAVQPTRRGCNARVIPFYLWKKYFNSTFHNQRVANALWEIDSEWTGRSFMITYKSMPTMLNYYCPQGPAVLLVAIQDASTNYYDYTHASPTYHYWASFPHPPYSRSKVKWRPTWGKNFCNVTRNLPTKYVQTIYGEGKCEHTITQLKTSTPRLAAGEIKHTLLF